MRTSSTLRRTGLAAAAVTLTFTMAACGSEDEPASGGTSPTTPRPTPATRRPTTRPLTTPRPTRAPSPPPPPSSARLRGLRRGRSDGAGSVSGMAQDPVATAASNNPLLKTLVAAVSGKLNPKVNLVDTLNGGSSPSSRL
jgi:hypothetical protein